MTGDEALAPAAVRELARAAAPELAGYPVVALGWATVDLEGILARLEAEGEMGRFVPAPRDELLGARAVVHRPEDGEDEPISILLEPDTEGPIAAALARRGEGLAAIWFRRGAQAPDVRDAPDEATRRFGRTAGGPLGPARLLHGGEPWGPHVLLLEPDRTG